MEEILAFGNERFSIDSEASRAVREQRSRIMLARALNLRTVVAFIGSGCSAPLGYPVWRELVTEIVKATIARVPSGPLQDRFIEIHSRLASPIDSFTTGSLMFYLSLCQQSLPKKNKLKDRRDSDPLHDYIAEQIHAFEKDAESHRQSDYDPYNVLKDLPIRRFVPTNYDLELEKMLKAKFDDGRNVQSFTQESHEALAGFAVVGLKGLTDSIFYCHGNSDKPDKIVASEADYQKWYLTQRNAIATTFRQSLDLVLSSNPVLFIGFGMEDDDLLRPLRVFHADDPERNDSRLLFALSENRVDNPIDNDWMDSRSDRYGVNFIPYQRALTNDPIERGRQLCKAIKQIESEWHHYRKEWWQKPPIRKVSVTVAAHKGGDRPKKPYQHYSVRLSEQDELAPAKTQEDLNVLETLINQKATRVVLVTGDGGSGKSWRVLNLLERLKRNPGRFKGGIFFWSSYYADDWLTGLDRALSYFQKEESVRARRLDRFRDCLENGTHLVVFDGFERLLRETENSKTGAPYSRNVKDLLEIMAHHEKGKTQSTMILTTRLVPESFQKWTKGPGKDGDPIRHFGVRRLTSKDLRNRGAFKGLSDENVGRICSLCGGHSYALLLAVQYLKPHETDFDKRFDTFRREISRRAPDSRIPEIIKLAIGAVDNDNEKIASKLLDRLAVFMSPIDRDTSQVCFEEAVKASGTEPRKATRETVINALLEAKLLLEVTTGTTEPNDEKRAHELVTVHPVVRSHVFFKSHGVVREVTPTFMLTGFTSGNLACHPGDYRGKKQVEGLFDALCTRALKSTSLETRRSLARAAFGVVRSRMESNSVPRWTSYDDYLRLGLRLLFLIKSVAMDQEGTWDYQDPALGREKQILNGILYPDELAWLYNDIGLALSSEGSMVDAYSLWEQGYEINRVTDSEEEGGQYMVQSHLHMSHLFIELGRLPRAAQFLTTTERANAIHGDPDFAGRILGYRALLAHLAGNVDEADKVYEKAVQKLAVKGRHNLRAESLFQRHWADLMLATNQPVKAEERAEIALSLAREGDFPDLQAYARKTRAHVWREMGQKDPKEVRVEYMAAMQHAEEFGIRRLQADIHSELARLALKVGDWETSRIRAMESLKLANELGLGLRRTHGLIVLGMAMEAGGNRDLAVSYFRHALQMSKLQGYHLRGREAEQHLLRLGERVDEFDRASND